MFKQFLFLLTVCFIKTFIIRAEPDTETSGSILTVKLDNTKSVPYFVKETIQEIQNLLGKS